MYFQVIPGNPNVTQNLTKKMALFLSTYTNKIDAKGRVSVPSQFRTSLIGENFSGMVLYESFVNECIVGSDIERIKKLSESIDNLDPFSEERDAFATAVLGGSTQISIDGDGRALLPADLLKKVKIKNELVFIGKGSTFELWEPKKFAEYMDKAKKEAKQKRNLLKVVK
jgi:MraZ protein